MKKIVIISDTHGNFSALESLLPIMKESDYLFHLGDFQRDIKHYERELGDKVISVKGNCDGGGDDYITQIDGVKIMLTHGDRYSVKWSLLKLKYKAKELGVDVVFYGHTHEADILEEDGIFFINPGCMNKFTGKSYCYAVITNGKIVPTIVYF